MPGPYFFQEISLNSTKNAKLIEFSSKMRYDIKMDAASKGGAILSVKTWKRIICLTVLVLVLALIGTTIFLAVKTKQAADKIDALNEKIEEMTQSAQDLPVIGDGVTQNDPTNPDNASEQDGQQGVGPTDSNSSEGPAYEQKYSDLYVDNNFQFKTDNDKICYLTFDDGPSKATAQILDTLKTYGVRATFFVNYADTEREKALMRRIVDEGHTIAIHSASHDYEKIYASVDAFLDDFEKISKQIEEVTGVRATMFRFPGGSVNSYNVKIYPQLIAEMTRRGYIYHDWNVYGGDNLQANVPAEEIKDGVIKGISAVKRNIILMHDGPGHQTTADALPGIITHLQEKDYRFAPLDEEVRPMIF